MAASDNSLWNGDWAKVRALWALDYSKYLFSHGAYGACPISVQQKQIELMQHVQRNPTGFFRRELMPLLDAARVKAAQYIGASADNVAWVRNATDALTVAIGEVPLFVGEEILITNQIYDSARVAVEWRVRETGAKVVEAFVPHTSDDAVLVNAIAEKVTEQTRMVIVDDIAAPTGRIFPVREIAQVLRDKNIALVVDGAHAPGMRVLDIDNEGADFWIGNFHKWVCAPYVAAVLWAAPKWHDSLKPLSASFRDDLPFPNNFGRLGTDDLTAALCVPDAIEFIDGLGAEKVRNYSHLLAKIGAEKISKALGTERVPGKFAGRHPIALPDGIAASSEAAYELQTKIATDLGAELSVTPALQDENHGYLMVSAFVYNHPDEYASFGEKLAEWLKK